MSGDSEQDGNAEISEEELEGVAEGTEDSLSDSKIPKGAASANCARCKATPVPSNFGSLRKCAFDEKGIFTPDNWNCVTAGELRNFAGESREKINNDLAFYLRYDDQSYAALYVPAHPDDVPNGDRIGPFRGGGFLAMSWYKHRGQTEIMLRVDPRNGGKYADAGLPLTAEEAEAAIVNLELAALQVGEKWH